MPLTQHAPTPVSLPRDDPTPTIPTRSPPSYTSSADARPIVSHQASRDSPPPALRPLSRPASPEHETPRRSNPQPEVSWPRSVPDVGLPCIQKAEREAVEDAVKQAPQVPEEPEEDPIDMETFQQILELDEEDDREFSKDMVWAYFTQAKQTFKDLDDALKTKDLPKLSSLGHFLKGSSAALGVYKVQASCEKIQHYGLQRDEDRDVDIGADEALKLIQEALDKIRVDYAVADKWLRNFYDDPEDEE
ncbi:histidine-phosphotransfer domain HPT domain-containing protein [Ephemerocybe angulata]|uniref:Histidine-phosphotransfer domain HPT domain-containing protein n=1 Tax=Ephemerocybe angulata TaxID=980116 RepID=A0A8H6I550_9AGAR|nr:histidine-phosphotransfer domain HPT domain-containing protein [Tulosesus angulatus]